MADKVDAPTGSDAGSIAKADGAGPKAIIKNVDMSEEMQQESVDVASAALEKYNIEKDIAAQIKKEFDRRHGPTWHVVVGKNFGSYVTHGASRIPSRIPCFRPRPSASRVAQPEASLRSPASLRRLVPQMDRADACMIRNETFHLLLHRLARHPHLEVMSDRPCWCLRA